MQAQTPLSNLTTAVKAITQTQVDLLKLQTVERTAYIGGSLFTLVIMVFVGIFVFLFSSLWLGFYFSNQLGNNYAGFGIITGFYGFIGVILWIGRKPLIERPIRNLFVRKLLNTTL